MIFLTPGEKIKSIRKRLGMIQQDLEDVNLKRNFVSMIENGDRNPSRETARIIAEKFNVKAKKLGVELSVDEDYLMISPRDQAATYCSEKLKVANDFRDFDEIITIAERYGLERHQIDAYVRMGDIYQEQNRFEDGFIHYMRALDACKNMQKCELQGIIYNKLGKCKYYEADYNEANEYFNKALHYANRIGDKKCFEDSLYNLIYSFRKLERHDKVIELSNMFFASTGDEVDLKQSNLVKLTKADAMINKKCFDEAKEILTKMLIDNNEHKEYFGYIYNSIGNVHLYKKEYQDAIRYYNMAQDMVEKYDPVHIHANLIDRANLYAETGETKEAIRLLEQGINIAQQHNDKLCLKKGFKVLCTLYHLNEADHAVEQLLIKYLEIVDLNKPKVDKRDIYERLALMYLNNNDIEKAKECLRLSLS